MKTVLVVGSNEVQYERFPVSVNVSVNDVSTTEKRTQFSDLMWSGLTPHQLQQTHLLFSNKVDVFASSEDDLGYTETVSHKIRLKMRLQ